MAWNGWDEMAWDGYAAVSPESHSLNTWEISLELGYWRHTSYTLTPLPSGASRVDKEVTTLGRIVTSKDALAPAPEQSCWSGPGLVALS